MTAARRGRPRSSQARSAGPSRSSLRPATPTAPPSRRWPRRSCTGCARWATTPCRTTDPRLADRRHLVLGANLLAHARQAPPPERRPLQPGADRGWFALAHAGAARPLPPPPGVGLQPGQRRRPGAARPAAPGRGAHRLRALAHPHPPGGGGPRRPLLRIDERAARSRARRARAARRQGAARLRRLRRRPRRAGGPLPPRAQPPLLRGQGVRGGARLLPARQPAGGGLGARRQPGRGGALRGGRGLRALRRTGRALPLPAGPAGGAPPVGRGGLPPHGWRGRWRSACGRSSVQATRRARRGEQEGGAGQNADGAPASWRQRSPAAPKDHQLPGWPATCSAAGLAHLRACLPEVTA